MTRLRMLACLFPSHCGRLASFSILLHNSRFPHSAPALIRDQSLENSGKSYPVIFLSLCMQIDPSCQELEFYRPRYLDVKKITSVDFLIMLCFMLYMYFLGNIHFLHHRDLEKYITFIFGAK